MIEVTTEQYCEKCGSRLKVETVAVDRFDVHTGRRVLANLGTCPNWKRSWWGGSNGHDHGLQLGKFFVSR